jgi:hypothetical protein
MFSDYLAKRRVRKSVCAELAAEASNNLTEIHAIQRLMNRAASHPEESAKAWEMAGTIVIYARSWTLPLRTPKT